VQLVKPFELAHGRQIGVVVELADADVVLEIFVLEVSQVQDGRGLLKHGCHVVLLPSQFVNNNDDLEAFAQSLKFEMSAPLPALAKSLDIDLKGAIFFLIQERLEEFLLPKHILNSLFPHKQVRSLAAIDLIGKSPKQTIPIPYNIPQPYLQRCYLLVEVSIILKIDIAQFEAVRLVHLLSSISLQLLIGLPLLSGLLDHTLLVLLPSHKFFYYAVQHSSRYKSVYHSVFEL
jgi:hypothetical protein